MHFLQLGPARFPHPRRHHPLPQSFLAHRDVMLLGQILARQGGAEIGVLALDNRYHFPLGLLGNLAVGWLSSQPVHHHSIALLLQPLQQTAHPARVHSHVLGGLLLGDRFLFGLLQPIQPVSFLLVHCDSFLIHAPISGAVNRNFLLCSNRNFSLCRDTSLSRFDVQSSGMIKFVGSLRTDAGRLYENQTSSSARSTPDVVRECFRASWDRRFL